jgi:adenylate cyclase
VRGPENGEELVEKVRRRLLRDGLIANSVGAGLVFLTIGFLIQVLAGNAEQERLGRENGPVLALYMLLTIPVTTMAANRLRAPVERWLISGGRPSDAVRDRALRLPVQLTSLSVVGWGAALALFLFYNRGEEGEIVATIGVALLLGGLTTFAIIYLLAERTLRPVTARVLAAAPPERPSSPGVHVRLVVAWTLATGVPLLGIGAVSALGLAGTDAAVEDVAGAALFLVAVALGVGLLGVVYVARSIADPVAAVRGAVGRVGEGDLDVRVEVDDGSEIGLLQAGFNRMADGLTERERMRDLFGRHVGHDVARAALESEVALGGEEREVAALFVDVVGSTALAARRPPAEVVALLNRFFGIVVEVTEAHGGLVNKFEGDAALCVFGAPVADDECVSSALAAARTLRDRLRIELPEIDAGIGVSAGTAVAGNIGAEERFEYTVIGDPVNEAARLCELSKERDERLLASGAALKRAGEAERRHWSVGEGVALRGRDAETRLATVA